MRSLCGVLVLCLGAILAFPQNQAEPSPVPDFSNDPCGNPLMESQLWIALDGEVLRVVNGNTLRVRIAGSQRMLEVRLAGTALQEHGSVVTDAKKRLTALSLNKKVSVFVNPDKWDPPQKQPGRMVAVISTPSVGNLALPLLSAGLLRFKEPRPYTVSRHQLLLLSPGRSRCPPPEARNLAMISL